MSNKPFRARQKAARAYQAAHPGTSYTRALRLVASSHRRPLTAKLGAARDSRAVTVNLECGSAGGAGPHCTVVGASADNTRDMVRYLASGLAAGQQPGDLELISVGDLCVGVPSHTCWDNDLFGDLFDEYLLERQRLLASLQCADVDAARQAGHRIASTVVLMVPTRHDLMDSGQLERRTRVARSAGVSIVFGLESASAATYSPDDPLGTNAVRRLLDDTVGVGTAANLSTTTIVHLGDDRGRLTVLGAGPGGRRRGGSSTVFTMQR